MPFSLQLPWPAGGADRRALHVRRRRPSRRCSIWSAPPAGTVELALLVTDDDAGGFVHWAVAGIPAAAGEVGRGRPDHRGRRGPQRLRRPRLGRPVPAGRRAAHATASRCTRSSQQAELPEGFTGDDLAAVATSANLAMAESTGVYTRAG